MKKFWSLALAFIMAMTLAVPAFAANTSWETHSKTITQEQSSNPFISPDSYIKYLESFGEEYSVFLSQFKALSFEKQQIILDVLSNGGTFDIELSKPIVDHSSPTARTS